MGSILADIESNFEPVTEQELKKIGFDWHYMRENLMLLERIIDTYVGNSFVPNKSLYPVEYKALWYEDEKRMEIYTMAGDDYWRRFYGLRFNTVKLKNPTLADVLASLTSEFLETRFTDYPYAQVKNPYTYGYEE